MKHLIIIALLFTSFPLIINSSEHDNHSEDNTDSQLDYHHKLISYKFGLSNLIDVYIAEEDTICDVLILDGKGICVSTTCPKSPILRWAFDVTDNEITDSPVIEENNYTPFYYKLLVG